jgi:hypothetical protein
MGDPNNFVVRTSQTQVVELAGLLSLRDPDNELSGPPARRISLEIEPAFPA